MKNWTIIAVFAVILGSPLKGAAQTPQYVTINCTTNEPIANCPLQTNQVVSLVGYAWYNNPSVSGSRADGTSINLLPLNRGYAAGGGYVGTPISTPQIVTGLTNVTVSLAPNEISGWATLQITAPATANVISNYVPADAIVIPASATGNVQIILESSTDLLNWSAANPGIYGASSATNRFFRVRAVHN